MDLDSYIFKKIYRLFSLLKIKNYQEKQKDVNAYFSADDLKNLSIIASLVAGGQFTVSSHKGATFLLGLNKIVIPEKFYRYPSKSANKDFVLYKVIFHAAESRREEGKCEDYLKNIIFNLQNSEKANLNFDGNEIFSNKFRNQLNQLLEDYSSWREKIERLLWEEITLQSGKPGAIDLTIFQKISISGKIDDKELSDSLESKNDTGEISSEIKLNVEEDEITIHEIDQKSKEDYTLAHNFEKVDTAEEFQGNWRDFDGSDDMEEQKDAIDELKMKDMIRTNETVHSIMQSDGFRNILASEIQFHKPEKEFSIPYKEWDDLKKIYHNEHCLVFPKNAVDGDVEYAENVIKLCKPVINRLRQKLALVFHRFARVSNMQFGDEPDLEAMVDRFADKKAGSTPSENIYLSQRKKKKDLAIIILADISLSSDAWAFGRRVLDMEKEAILVFGEILAENGERFSVAGFSSQTRNRLDYITAKDFTNDWHQSKKYIAGFQPFGYTRIGPALRHATQILAKEKNRHKWILFLSDAKPNDYDRYEGIYGLKDVNRAVKEASKKGINFHAIVSSGHSFNLLTMFGSKNFQLAMPNKDLAEILTNFYSKIAIA